MYREPASPCTCRSSHAPERGNYGELKTKQNQFTCNRKNKMFPHGKIGDEGPLLDGLVVGRLVPHQADVEGQTSVLRTHDHGGEL